MLLYARSTSWIPSSLALVPALIFTIFHAGLTDGMAITAAPDFENVLLAPFAAGGLQATHKVCLFVLTPHVYPC